MQPLEKMHNLQSWLVTSGVVRIGGYFYVSDSDGVTGIPRFSLTDELLRADWNNIESFYSFPDIPNNDGRELL
ncbi:MAG: hypothetical protein NC548_11015 [Lachnospiraceae bacterium]|nr:hypothetical protein [Lachnospiraceae bacterium]